MKKLIAILLAALMLLSIVACGEKTPDDEPVNVPYASAEELLNIILTKYNESADEMTQIGVNGGNVFNFETIKEGGPAKFVALEDSDYDYHLGYPVADVAKMDDAASMYHWMNSNVLTCYAVHFANKADVDAMVDVLKDNISARQWECGHPEKLFIVKAPGNYLVVVWGVVTSGGVAELVADSIVANVEGATLEAEVDLL